MGNKVVIEITPKGWHAEVHVSGGVVREEWERAPMGAKQTKKSESFEKPSLIEDGLYEALSGISGVASDVMDML